jgi:hypothetical protein
MKSQIQNLKLQISTKSEIRQRADKAPIGIVVELGFWSLGSIWSLKF